MLDSTALAANLASVRGRVLAIRESAVLIAVSKTQPPEAIRSLYLAGQRDFGENYAQELVAKAKALRDLPDLRWHFIGHLQTNKVRAIAPFVHAVHSVDSVRLAGELSRRAGERLPIFLEVNLDGEAGKAGVTPADAPAVSAEIAALPGLELRGLMAIPAPMAVMRPSFARLRALETACRPATRGGLSMGMSGDFEEALREGATHVRVGTALFGAR